MENMFMEFKVTFAKAVRIERVRQDVTQEELAEMVGITPQYLCKIENVRRTASVEMYVRIAGALGLRLELGGSGSDESNGQ
ncbi:MAG: helix-turn-helix domain-containing protein [Oscillospiraceae bacterium]|nr:helix-turn-helix domain-containing protein [Oscillospiraceae bacterium]